MIIKNWKLLKLCILSLAFIYTVELISNDKIYFLYEFNQLKSDNDSSEVIFSFSYPQSNFIFTQKNNAFESNIELQLFIKSKNDSLSKLWEINTLANSETEKKDKIFIGSKSFKLKNDNYNITIDIIDQNSKKKYSYNYNNFLLKYNQKEQISDIITAFKIDSIKGNLDNFNSDFIRNNLYVIPNSTEEYYGTSPKILIYNEFYNLSSSKDYVYSLRILNAVKSKVIAVEKSLDSKMQNLNNAQNYLELILDTIPSGLYYIETSLYSNNSIIDQTTKKIYIINPQKKPGINVYFSEDEEFERSEFSTFTKEKIDEEYLYWSIIASKNERDLFSKLSDLKAKQKYFFKYWENRKIDANALVNQTRENFKDRIIYSKKFFKEINNRGLSDREKIIIKHGIPIETQTYEAQDGNKAYQSFYFSDLYGGAYFYFVDVKSNGIYKLVHSTAIGEIQHYDWEVRFLRDFKQQ